MNSVKYFTSGNITLIVIGCAEVGGVNRVYELNEKWGRFDVSLSGDPTTRLTLWSTTIGGLFLGMSMFGANQPCMQRTCTLKNVSLAKWSAFIGATMLSVFYVMSTVVGLVIFAYYTSLGCDPVQSGQISSGNQILPYYIMDVLAYPGLPGVLFSSLFSGALSTLSSSINSMSAVMWEDILGPFFKDWEESTKTYCNKILTVVFGLCCLASSFVMLFVGGSLVAIAASILGAVLGPLLGVFFLAVLVPFCNWKGALIGGIVSAIVNIWMLFGNVIFKTQITRLPAPTFGCPSLKVDNSSFNSTTSEVTSVPLTNTTLSFDTNAKSEGFLLWIYSVSFTWYPFIGVMLCLVCGVGVSLVSGYTRLKDVNPDHVVCKGLSCYQTKRKLNVYQLAAVREKDR